MFYQEIIPGVFLSNDQKLHYKLQVCPCCGGEDTLSHHKYKDRCIECGKLYNIYSTRRTARCKHIITNKAAAAHLVVIEEFIKRRDAGFKVPATLDEEYAETLKILENAAALETYKTVYCSYCGAEITVLENSKPPYRCDTCESVYKRYKELYGSASRLSQDECDELASIIAYYINAHNHGQHTPQFSRAIEKLQKRIVHIGGERYKLYGQA